MKKKNIEILFEAFQRMVKRMKTPLDDKKGEKYVSDLFKKFPDIKKTKILERQLQEMIQEYILLQQIDEIENTPKHVLSLEKPTREPIASSRENSEEYIHFLKHPVQRFIAAIGVLGLGLLLAIPLMQNQIDTPEPSFRESFNEIKSTFKWEGPKMPSLDEALNAQHYSFVLEGEIPAVLDSGVILSTLEALPDDSFFQLGLSKKYPITLKNPQFPSFYPSSPESKSFLIFDAVGKNDAGQEVFFKQEVPLLGDE